MGAVYNNEYLKAITFFAVFAALVIMSDRVNGVFGFGAFAFLIFTMFDAYRSAEARARARLEAGAKPAEPPSQDRTIVAWGIFLIVLGVIFLLQNIIPYYFLNRLWPLVFIFLGGYLIYRAVREKDESRHDSPSVFTERKEF
jgi:4-hydroxybenzoate polyprenyltransferase